MSESGLVSRVTPVHTAMRNCTRDEGRPFGFGNQVADPKPPQAAVVKSDGGERCGNVGAMIPAGIRRVGSAKLDQAVVWNVRTWPAMAREKAQAAPTARPKVPMRRRGTDCLVVAMKRV